MINMQVRDSYNKIALSRETAEEIWERAMESAKTLPSERRNHRGKNKGKNLRRTLLIAAVIASLMTVTALASVACLGKKQFERLFAEQVGANPKEYARIARFQKSLKCMQSHPGGISQAQLAYHCGYADQSHFIREFRQFSGYTPGALLKVCAPYSDLFTDPS